ncbi:apocytochrome f [Thermostichus vulcanus]|uniref:Cytochrome f n=1 Tax=Thermostichus vulcanus str. 'Rupite' TaxID=2813851 RepID=A0ABT0CCP7_THEVL|nr:apocytochrome f [Thermostichus vulcanus]MCJ2543561.1 apocytochrome f [Thermostichus vulcanus str. 'Rupite']
MKRICLALCALLLLLGMGTRPAAAFPYYAQMAYDNPREATGKIVCANCHLNAMPTRAEVPQAVTPGQVFDIKVGIPYDLSKQQLLADGSKGGLNVGAVVVLPEGFRLATEEEMTEAQREETAETYITPYSDEKPHILLVGPLAGEEHQEIVFPVVAPDPAEDPSVAFMKYKVFVGANRGRGQLNPDGSLSNNNVFRAPATGRLVSVALIESDISDLPADLASLVPPEYELPGTRVLSFETENGIQNLVLPPGPDLIINLGDSVKEGDPVTNNPNVGGFGQVERDLVLQSPDRVKWLLAFLAAVFIAQVVLVLKKKQVELIQAAEILG